MEKWLANPSRLRADKDAEYTAVYEIDQSDIKEPILCCPNDPGYAKPLSAKPLSQVAGAKIDKVFIGSCMTNMGTYLPPANCWTR
jgi:aconitate hydratase 2/2-methylisocitrate dehydratase